MSDRISSVCSTEDKKYYAQIERLSDINNTLEYRGAMKLNYGRVISRKTTAYLICLPVSSWRWNRRLYGIVSLGRQGRPTGISVVREDSVPCVALPFGMLVIHVVASLAENVLANIASRKNIPTAAQGTLGPLARGHCVLG